MDTPFLPENFLLSNRTAEKLYFEFAQAQPIFDYHCHLPPADIAGNRHFENLTRIWLAGDHYKWRVMRANGMMTGYPGASGYAPGAPKDYTYENLRNAGGGGGGGGGM